MPRKTIRCWQRNANPPDCAHARILGPEALAIALRGGCEATLMTPQCHSRVDNLYGGYFILGLPFQDQLSD